MATSASVDVSQLREALAGNLSPLNGVRQAAEAWFNAERSRSPSGLAVALLQIVSSLSSPEDMPIRSLACVLMRRLLTQSESSPWADIPQEHQEAMKAELCRLLTAEKDKRVRSKIGHIVGELASGLFSEEGDDAWPALLPLLFQMASGGDAAQMETSCGVLAAIGYYVARHMQHAFDHIKGLLAACISRSSSPGVQTKALQALGCILANVQRAADRDGFSDLAPVALQALAGLIERNMDTETCETLELLIDICDLQPRFYKAHLSAVVQGMVSIASNVKYEDSVRQLALEFLTTLAESASSMVRKMNGTFTRDVVPVIINFTLEFDDMTMTEWAKPDESGNAWAGEEDIDYTNSDVGLEALDRIARAVGHKRVLPAAFAIIGTLMADEADWRKRYAGLMAICHVAESMPSKEPNLGEITRQVVNFAVRDQVPRVRYAAINALGQMCTDCSPAMQTRHHVQVLPCLTHALNDSCDRVASHAAAALINFAESCDAQVMVPYVESLLTKLFEKLQTSHRLVQEQVICAIASTADSAAQHFKQYYAACMPTLKNILIHAEAKEQRMLRAKSLECISLIGVAVGKELFAADAMGIMHVMMKLQTTCGGDDDPMKTYLLSAWMRICSILGSDFEQCLPLVMPSVLQYAKIPIDLVEVAEDEDGEDFESNGQMPLLVGDRIVRVRTSAIEDKVQALSMLASFAHDMKEAFFPFLEEVTTVVTPLILTKNSPHGDLRATAMASLPDLVLCAARKIPPSDPQRSMVKQLVDFVVGQLLEALQSEEELEVVKTATQALKGCVGSSVELPPGIAGASAHRPVLGDEQILAICGSMVQHIGQSMQRRAIAVAEKRAEAQEDGELDEESEEELAMRAAEEEELHFMISEMFGELMKTHGEGFLRIFGPNLMSWVVDLSHPNRLPSDRKIAVFIIDDMLEHLGASIDQATATKFADILCANALDGDFSLRQASVFGLGTFAEKFKTQKDAIYAQIAAKAFSQVVAAIKYPFCSPDEQEEGAMATDNAVSALGKILGACLPGIDANAGYNLFLNALPLCVDLEESRVTIRLLCQALLDPARQALVLGPGGERGAKAMHVLAQVIGTAKSATEDQPLITQAMEILQSALPQTSIQLVWSKISNEQQKNIMTIAARVKASQGAGVSN